MRRCFSHYLNLCIFLTESMKFFILHTHLEFNTVGIYVLVLRWEKKSSHISIKLGLSFGHENDEPIQCLDTTWTGNK